MDLKVLTVALMYRTKKKKRRKTGKLSAP